MKTTKTLDRQRSRRSLHGVVVCVRSRDGWCALRDQRKTAYRDNVETRCGMVVTLPWGIDRREPDCIECKKADKQQAEPRPGKQPKTMNEETKPPTTEDVVTEQDKGRCAPAPGSAIPGAIVAGESIRDIMHRAGDSDPYRAWHRLHGGRCSGGGGPC